MSGQWHAPAVLPMRERTPVPHWVGPQSRSELNADKKVLPRPGLERRSVEQATLPLYRLRCLQCVFRWNAGLNRRTDLQGRVSTTFGKS